MPCAITEKISTDHKALKGFRAVDKLPPIRGESLVDNVRIAGAEPSAARVCRR